MIRTSPPPARPSRLLASLRRTRCRRSRATGVRGTGAGNRPVGTAEALIDGVETLVVMSRPAGVPSRDSDARVEGRRQDVRVHIDNTVIDSTPQSHAPAD